MKIRLLLYFLFSLLLAFPTFSQGVSGSVAINDGATITNNKNKQVLLTVLARGASQMMISNNGSFIGTQWRRYENRVANWKLTGTDGVKHVYAKFRDAKGNVSEVVDATIELDTEPPAEADILINGGKDYTNNKKTRVVYLALTALDAYKMRVSNRIDFVGSNWMIYRPKMIWKITANDGLKTVYVQYSDRAGNKTAAVSDNITLDTKPPIGCKIVVENGDKYTRSHNITIKCKADGASEMIVRGGSGWIPYAESFQLPLSSGDGEKQVVMRFRDPTGNQSVVVYDNIIVDTQPPKNAFVRINNGSKYTRGVEVNIKTLVSGAAQIMVSNNPSFQRAIWKPYSPFISSWNLIHGDGEKTVYIKFMDKAGNISKVFNDKIILDKTPPATPFIRISAEGAVYDPIRKATLIKNNTKVVDLEIKSEGASYMMLSNISTFYGARWEVYKPKYKDWELGGKNDGVREVFVKFRDRSGNISTAAGDKVIIDTSAPVDCKIIINENKEFCTNTDAKVTLSLFARNANFMMISNNPTFKNAKWIPYKTQVPWTLVDKEGISTVLVKYKDLAGNESQLVTDEIILDRTPPSAPSILINKGEKLTNNPDKVVLVKVRAKDAVMMQVGTIANFRGVRWQKYSPLNFNQKLFGNDGLKVLYARFKDEAGNLSRMVSDSIHLDRTPPKKGTIKINGGKTISNNKDKKVTLALFSNGVTEMRLSNRFDLKDGKWEPYKQTKDWVLKGDDGLKTVYAQFRDRVGNVSKTAYDRIGVDTQAPKEGRISINGKARYCINVNGYVTLKLYAKEAREMMLSNTQDFKDAEWIPYEGIHQNWILSEGDGEKTVYAKFRDTAQNETLPIMASITLDRQEPVHEEIIINNGDKYTSSKSKRVRLQLHVEGAVQMIVGNDRFFRPPSVWRPIRESMEWPLIGKDGKKNIHVKFKDKAGNESSEAIASIILDTEAPIPLSIRVNDGQKTTEKQSVTLQIKAKKAAFMKVSNNSKFTGAIWEPYSEEKEWLLTSGEGLKTIYVKFKDKAQNTSAMKFASVTLLNSY